MGSVSSGQAFVAAEAVAGQ